MTTQPKNPKDITDYRPDPDVSHTERAAHFLVWAADNFPTRPVPYKDIFKVANMRQTSRLREDSPDLERFKKATMKTVKKIIFEEYSRGLVPHPGFGIRATTGSEDVAQTVVERDVRRMVKSAEALDRSKSLVKVKEIKNKAVRDRFEQIDRITNQLTTASIWDRLLPKPKD